MAKPKNTRPKFKTEAEERDVPYQSLIKTWLAEDINKQR